MIEQRHGMGWRPCQHRPRMRLEQVHAARGPVAYRTEPWARGPQTDQGQTGCCTGFALLNWYNGEPIAHALPNDEGFKLYRQNAGNDEFSENDAPDEYDFGSSLHASVVTARQRGWASAESERTAWTTNAGTVAEQLRRVDGGQVMLAITWRQGMSRPDNGVMRWNGPVEGGHAMTLRWYDLARNQFLITNSWGSGWGINGEAWLPFDDLQAALNDQGEASTLVELSALPTLVGGNAGHNLSGIWPQVCAVWGARVVRFPLLANADPVPAIQACKALGILPLPLLVRESFFVGDELVRDVPAWGEILRPHITHLQGLNEADGVHEGEGASWVQDPTECNRWLGLIRAEFPRPAYKLIGPGLVSGQPGWAGFLDLSLLDGLGVHPYAKEARTARLRARLKTVHPRDYPAALRLVPPGTPVGVPAGPMLEEYARYGLPLWITEYDSRTPGMGEYLASRSDVAAACVFCLHSYLDFGLSDHPSALADFLAATGGALPPLPEPVPPQPPPTPPSPPEPPMPTDPFPGYLILEGMATALRKLGCRPLSDERYFNEDMSVVLAEDAAGKRHWLLYNKRSNDVTEFPGEKVA